MADKEMVRDIMVDRLMTIARQYYWSLIRRTEQEDEVEITLSLNASAMDRTQRRTEVDRLVGIVEALGWDDRNVHFTDTGIELTLFKIDEAEEEPSLEIEASRE